MTRDELREKARAQVMRIHGTWPQDWTIDPAQVIADAVIRLVRARDVELLRLERDRLYQLGTSGTGPASYRALAMVDGLTGLLERFERDERAPP